MLIEEMRTGKKPKFAVQFKLRCFNPESRCHILLTYLPEIKDFTFSQVLDDEEFAELENMMHSVGVEFRQLVKIPYVEEEAPPTIEIVPEEEEDVLQALIDSHEGEDCIFGRLFDELLNVREFIKDIYDSKMEEDQKNELIQKKARDFSRLGDAFRRHIRGELNVSQKTN